MSSHGIPEIDRLRCTGCGRCVAACRQRLVTLEVSGYRKHAVVTANRGCTRCLCCAASCPVRAIAFAGGDEASEGG